MKKISLILVGMVLAVGILGAAGYAYAQTQDPPDAAALADGVPSPFGGRMNQRGIRGNTPGFFGMGNGEGPLHDYIFPAIAEAFGLTEGQMASIDEARETIQAIRAELTLEEFQAKLQAAFNSALDAAVADGVITQEQANVMLERRTFGGSQAFGRMGRGMGSLGRMGQADGILHDYMQSARAEALGVSVDELQSWHEDPTFHLWSYAVEQGWTAEEFQALMQEAFQNAVQQALEDGAITPEQAEMLLSRQANFGRYSPSGFGHPNGMPYRGGGN